MAGLDYSELAKMFIKRLYAKGKVTLKDAVNLALDKNIDAVGNGIDDGDIGMTAKCLEFVLMDYTEAQLIVRTRKIAMEAPVIEAILTNENEENVYEYWMEEQGEAWIDKFDESIFISNQIDDKKSIRCLL